jgi:hypothetical protein
MPKKERPPDPKRLFEIYREGLTPDRSILLDRYGMWDIVFKAVGVSSVGTFCCVALFLTADDEPSWSGSIERRHTKVIRVVES